MGLLRGWGGDHGLRGVAVRRRCWGLRWGWRGRLLVLRDRLRLLLLLGSGCGVGICNLAFWLLRLRNSLLLEPERIVIHRWRRRVSWRRRQCRLLRLSPVVSDVEEVI